MLCAISYITRQINALMTAVKFRISLLEFNHEMYFSLIIILHSCGSQTDAAARQEEINYRKLLPEISAEMFGVSDISVFC